MVQEALFRRCNDTPARCNHNTFEPSNYFLNHLHVEIKNSFIINAKMRIVTSTVYLISTSLL